MNAWLVDECVVWAKAHAHPEQSGRTIWEVFEEERPRLIRYRGRFDGFHARPASVSKTCLVRFDNNRYSVSASAVGRPVDIHAYADRIVIRQDGRIVAEHPRVRPWAHRLRPLALRAGPGAQARRLAQRRPIQELGAAGGAGSCPAQPRRLRRRRPSDGQRSSPRCSPTDCRRPPPFSTASPTIATSSRPETRAGASRTAPELSVTGIS